jgi:hypothetical protein
MLVELDRDRTEDEQQFTVGETRAKKQKWKINSRPFIARSLNKKWMREKKPSYVLLLTVH